MFPFDQAAAVATGFVIIALSYIIFGLTGFGASLISIPVLSHFYPLPFVIVLACLLDLGAALVLGGSRRRAADWSELKRMLPFAFIGTVVGVTLLIALPQNMTLLALALFISGHGIYGLWQPVRARPVSAAWAPFAGFLGGSTGAVFGIGGPAFLIYLARRLLDKDRLVATMSFTVAFNLSARVLVFAFAGLLQQAHLALALAWFVPAAALGVWTGTRLRGRVSHAGLLRLLYIVLIGCGASLIVRAAGMN